MRRNCIVTLAVTISAIMLLAACLLGPDIETLRQKAAEKNYDPRR